MKVFISSTFSDLDKERSYIVRTVFPRIRAQYNGLELNEIDLRWGITPTEANAGLVTDLCLRYLHDSKPFFIAIIGDRYGSIFGEKETILSEYVESIYPHVRRDLHERRSITEIEIMNGLLRSDSDDMHAIFFIKKTDLGRPYAGESIEQYDKLTKLKAALRAQSKYKVVEFSKLEDFDCIEEFITEKIKNDNLYVADELHERFDNILRRAVACRNGYRKVTPASNAELDRILTTLETCPRGLTLMSRMGMGLSTSLAQLGKEFCREQRQFIHLYGDELDIPAHPEDLAAYIIKAARAVLKEYEAAGCRIGPKRKGFKGVLWWLMSDYFPAESIDDDAWAPYLVSSYKWCLVLDNTDSAAMQNINLMTMIVDNFEAVRRQLASRGYDIDIKFIYTTHKPVQFRFLPRVYETMLPGAFDVASFYRSYLASYSKKLDDNLLAALTVAPVSVNPLLARWLADYLREYVRFERIEDTVARIRKINTAGDVIRLFTDEMLKLGRNECKFMASLLWIYKTGLSHHDVMELSEGYDRLAISSMFSCLSRFMNQSDRRDMYVRNNYVLTEIVNMLGYDKEFTQATAKKTSPHFFNKIKDLHTAEDFLTKSKKVGWWMYADAWLEVVPKDTPPEWAQLKHQAFGIGVKGSTRDWARLELIMRCGGFSIENAHKVFSYYRYSWAFKLSNARVMLWKRQKKGESIGQETWDELYRASVDCCNTRNPTRLELCNYLEALVHAKSSKQLSVELGNPPVLNYVWNTSIYLFAWTHLRALTGEWLIQDDLLHNTLIIKGVMRKVAYLLGDQKALDFYFGKNNQEQTQSQK